LRTAQPLHPFITRLSTINACRLSTMPMLLIGVLASTLASTTHKEPRECAADEASNNYRDGISEEGICELC
jgi:hypothetical protein